MNKSMIIALTALAALVVALPIYAWLEPARMAAAQEALRQEFVTDAAALYVENCAVCHGANGEGIAANPPLDNAALREADYDTLVKTIARGRYGTAMAGWHTEEGGLFNDYQIEELAALIRYVDWAQVGELSAQMGMIPPALPMPEVSEDFLAQVAALDAGGERWAAGMQVYASSCATCHGINGEGSSLAVPLNTPEVRATDEAELARIVTEGVPGTLMAPWGLTLDDGAIVDVVAFLQNWDAITEAGMVLAAPAPREVDLNNPEEVLALGEQLFDTVCAACHGENGSGGLGPAINSQQFLGRKSDEQIASTVIKGGQRPNSQMPAFGDRLTSVEIDALVSFIRAWEPTAPSVANPRGSAQGGGPPWMRATPDAANPIAPGPEGSPGAGQGGGRGQGQGQSAGAASGNAQTAPATQYQGTVASITSNALVFRTDAGIELEAMMGPPWYWEEQGISLSPGDRVELEGFEGQGHMEVNWIRNLTTGQEHMLRTAEGVPVWQGQ